MKRLSLFRRFLAIPSLFALMACGSGGNGTMSVSLTDAPTEDYSAVYVTIREVQVHKQGGNPGGGWVTVAQPNRTYNLLDLTDGVVEGLGEGPLEAGSYSQIRLIIGTTPDDRPNILCHSHPFANYVIDADDQEIHELTVPSGEQTGLKIVCAGKCEVAENQTTELILDFDAAASVVVAGNSGIYNLKPTIKLLETQDFTLVTGRVLEAGGSGVANALVSAQLYDPLAADAADRVRVRTSTLSDANGDYQLFLKPGDYNLVAVAPGFSVSAVNFSAVAATDPIRDFSLTAVETGSLGGALSIGGAGTDTFAFLSLERELDLGGVTEAVEVQALDLLNGALYSTELAVGNYGAVASTCDFPTQEAVVEIQADVPSVLDLTF